MAEIKNATLRKYAAALCARKEWETQQWDANDSATMVLLTVLEEMGCKEMLKPEHRESRKATRDIIASVFKAGAPINFRREWLCGTKGADGKPLAPEMPKSASKASTSDEVL